MKKTIKLISCLLAFAIIISVLTVVTSAVAPDLSVCNHTYVNSVCSKCGAIEKIDDTAGSGSTTTTGTTPEVTEPETEAETEIETEAPHVHSYDNQLPIGMYLASSATCTSAARYYYSCSCGASSSSTFASGSAPGHNYVNNVCTLCGLHKPLDDTAHSHSYTEMIASSEYLASAASCLSPATYYYSCSCGASSSSTFTSGSALGHTFDQKGQCLTCSYKAASYIYDYANCLNIVSGESKATVSSIKINDKIIYDAEGLKTKADGTIVISTWSIFSFGGVSHCNITIDFENGEKLNYSTDPDIIGSYGGKIKASYGNLSTDHDTWINNRPQYQFYDDYKTKGWVSNSLDLSDHPGESFDVTISAVTAFQNTAIDVVEITNLLVYCSHENGTIDDYESHNDGTHLKLICCSDCGEIVFSGVGNCDLSNSVCELCGYVDPNCEHTNTTAFCTSIGNNNHSSGTKCADCEEVLYSSDVNCTFVNDVCSGCGASEVVVETPCTHNTIRDVFTSNNDGTHNAEEVCSDCGKVVYSYDSIACNYENGKCTFCQYEDSTCKHTNVTSFCRSIGNNKHSSGTKCADCEEVLYSSDVNCTFVNDVCSSCGASEVEIETQPLCEHIRTEGIPESNNNGTHRIDVVCLDCGETASSSPTLNCTFVVGTCKECGYTDLTKCDHSVKDAVFESHNDGTHTVHNICSGCKLEISYSPSLACTYDKGKCTACGYVDPDWDEETDTETETETDTNTESFDKDLSSGGNDSFFDKLGDLFGGGGINITAIAFGAVLVFVIVALLPEKKRK